MNPTIRAGSMQGFPQLMRSLGHDPRPLLARHRLSEAALADEDRRLPLQSVFDVFRLAAEATGLDDFGLRAAQHQDIGMLGPLALAMQHAPTMAESIGFLTRYLCVQSPALESTFHPVSSVDAQAFEVRYDPAARGRLNHVPQIVDHGLALMHLVLRTLAGPRYALEGLSLTWRPARGAPAHQRFFGAPLYFDQPFGALHYATDMLTAPTIGARPALLRVAAEYLEREAPAAEAGVAARVRVAVKHALAQQLGTKEAVAGMLGLHPRTLQRQLQGEGTSFEAERDAVRQDAVRRYLAGTDYSLAEVASLVGFSEQSAFTRFCRRAFGCTPSAMRSTR